MTDLEPPRRAAIVTGAARGIGAATASVLEDAGFRVATFDVLPAPAADSDHRAHFVVDVSNSSQVSASVTAAVRRFGRLDVLVNNAGILRVHAVDDTPEDVWDRVLAVNVKSVFLMSQAAIPHLRAAGGGSIVNVASVHAFASVPRAAAYAASKGAVVSLTRQMALDYYDDGIRVNAVLPGSIDTEMSTQHGAAMARDGVAVSTAPGAIARTARPEEVARVIAFLCSDQASFMTGAPVAVDGGMLARLM